MTGSNGPRAVVTDTSDPSDRPGGSVISEGVEALGIDLLQARYPVSGDGITVGIISDSFAASARARTSFDDDVLTGDLPDVALESIVLFEGPTGGRDEGRAMAQIIHDIAPDADLLFHASGDSEDSLKTALRTLADQGADLIVEDVLVLNQPMFQDGIAARELEQIVASGIPVISAAGNFGTDSYEAEFLDSGLSFRDVTFGGAAPPINLRADDYRLHNFEPFSQTPVTAQTFDLSAGERLFFSFQWDEPFPDSPQSAPGTQTDLDLFLFDTETGALLRTDFANRVNTDPGGFPYETLRYTNLTSDSQTVSLVIAKKGEGRDEDFMKYVPVGFQGDFVKDTGVSPTGFGKPTIYGLANTVGTISVAAANFDKTPLFGTAPAEIAPYSSIGGVPILFDADGTRIDGEGLQRPTPDLTGPDNVQTTFFGPLDLSDNEIAFRFPGTSAAAPHIAGLAALLLELDPTLQPAELESVLQTTAQSMAEGGFGSPANPGFDRVSGSGFVNALAAAAFVEDGINRFVPVDPQAADGQQAVIESLTAAGAGLRIINVSYEGYAGEQGTPSAISTFGGIDFGDIPPEDNAPDDGGSGLSRLALGTGVLLSTGAAVLPLSNTNPEFSQVNNVAGDERLTDLAATVFDGVTGTNDAASLIVEFEVTDPSAQVISVDLILGSEELPQPDTVQFVDIAAVFLNGENIAFFDDSRQQPLSVVEDNQDAGYFLSNAPHGVQGEDGPRFTIEYDALSRPLTLIGTPNVGQVNTLEFIIADTNDFAGDTGLFISNLRTLGIPPFFNSAGDTGTNSYLSDPPILGDDNDNIQTGSVRANYIEGRGGNDTIRGLDGADFIDGGLGADRLIGGPGPDVYITGGVRAATAGQGVDIDNTLPGDGASGDTEGEEGGDTVEGSPIDLNLDLLLGSLPSDVTVYKDINFPRREARIDESRDRSATDLDATIGLDLDGDGEIDSLFTIGGGLTNTYLDFGRRGNDTTVTFRDKSAIRADRFEAAGNDGRLSATDLGPAVTTPGLSGLTLELNDDDWYAFTLTEDGTGEHFVRADFNHIEGDVDLQLYDADGDLRFTSNNVVFGTPIDRPDGAFGGEQISLKGLEPGDYTVRVYGFAGDANPSYDLSFNLPQGPVQPDRFEFPSNDTPDQATVIGPIVQPQTLTGLTLEAGDEDWFEFTLSEQGRLQDAVQIAFDPGAGDLRLTLILPGGTVFDRATRTDDGKSISLRGQPPGVYQVGIAAETPGTGVGDYTLLVKAGGTDDTGARATIDLAALSPQDGIVIDGTAPGDALGQSVGAPGDVNNDGVDDLLIGAPGSDGLGRVASGQGVLLFGARDIDQTAVKPVATLRPEEGVSLAGARQGERAGETVSGLGDINGDGVDDFLVGARGAGSVNLAAGTAYVVFGDPALTGDPGSDGLPVLDLALLNSQNGFVLTGITGDARAGLSASGAGDINGDGYRDIVIGGAGADGGGIGERAGESYVVFGGPSIGTGGVVSLDTLDGTSGFRLGGLGANDLSGASVTDLGDVNGDGIDDFAIGGVGAGPNAETTGQAYVIFGDRTIGETGRLDLTVLDERLGFQIDGTIDGARTGIAVSGAGDLNLDGFDDFVIGADFAEAAGGGAGETYVIFGRADISDGGFLDLAALEAGEGLTIVGLGAGDRFGRSVSTAGDFNNDGASDIVIGAWGSDATGQNAGEAYVLYGNTDLADQQTLTLTALDGRTGTLIEGARLDGRAGFAVSDAGDVNADGVDDILIGAPGDPDAAALAGSTYVLFGRQTGPILRDRFEENDSQATAFDLGAVSGRQVYRSLTVEANDTDWFTFRLDRDTQAGDYLEIVFDHAKGNLALDLFTPSGQIIRGSDTLNDREVVSLEGLPAGVYAARVQGINSADNPNYTLVLSATPDGSGAAILADTDDPADELPVPHPAPTVLDGTGGNDILALTPLVTEVRAGAGLDILEIDAPFETVALDGLDGPVVTLSLPEQNDRSIIDVEYLQFQDRTVATGSSSAGLVPTLTATDALAGEGPDEGNALIFKIGLAHAVAPHDVSFRYETHAGSAVAGGDFEPVSGTMTLAQGERYATVVVPVRDDLLPEADETLSLRLFDFDGVQAPGSGDDLWLAGLIHSNDRALADAEPFSAALLTDDLGAWAVAENPAEQLAAFVKGSGTGLAQRLAMVEDLLDQHLTGDPTPSVYWGADHA